MCIDNTTSTFGTVPQHRENCGRETTSPNPCILILTLQYVDPYATSPRSYPNTILAMAPDPCRKITSEMDDWHSYTTRALVLR